jgi:hypothetical protein
MNKLFLLLVFIISSFEVFCQVKVIDFKSKEAIPYVYLTNKSESIKLITNGEGEFILDSLWLNQDTLKIDCIGYESKYVIINDLKKVKAIELNPLFTNLEGVVVRADKKNFKRVKLGVSSKPKTRFFDYSLTASNGEERAVWIPNKHSVSGVLKSINIYVTDLGFPDADFRIHVYECNKFVIKPGIELTKTNIIKSGAQGNEWVEIDMTNYRIVVPENGLFIGVEWFDHPKSFYFNDTLIRNGVTYRDSKTKDTVYKIVRQGNGVVLGSVDELYKTAKYKNWWRISHHEYWKNRSTTYIDESKFNQPDTFRNGMVYYVNENNFYLDIPCIYAEISIPKEKVKHDFEDPKNRKLNKLEKSKEDLFQYPQSSITDLFNSLIKAFENKNEVYVLKYLCTYRENDFENIYEDLNEKRDSIGEFMNDETRLGVINSISKLKDELLNAVLIEIEPFHYKLNFRDQSFDLILENGKWKINPYSYRIVEK